MAWAGRARPRRCFHARPLRLVCSPEGHEAPGGLESVAQAMIENAGRRFVPAGVWHGLPRPAVAHLSAAPFAAIARATFGRNPGPTGEFRGCTAWSSLQRSAVRGSPRCRRRRMASAKGRARVEDSDRRNGADGCVLKTVGKGCWGAREECEAHRFAGPCARPRMLPPQIKDAVDRIIRLGRRSIRITRLTLIIFGPRGCEPEKRVATREGSRLQTAATEQRFADFWLQGAGAGRPHCIVNFAQEFVPL